MTAVASVFRLGPRGIILGSQQLTKRSVTGEWRLCSSGFDCNVKKLRGDGPGAGSLVFGLNHLISSGAYAWYWSDRHAQFFSEQSTVKSTFDGTGSYASSANELLGCCSLSARSRSCCLFLSASSARRLVVEQSLELRGVHDSMHSAP